MKKTLFFILAIFCSFYLSAQNVDDALRFSQNTYDATARSAAMGGSFGALGGDFSSLSINPAGLGIYRSSEFTVTPGILFAETNSSNFSDENVNFIIGNLGFVWSVETGNSDWKFFNFGLGYNRLNDFNRDLVLQNSNSTTSLLDVWAGDATEFGLGDFGSNLGYETYLLDFDENAGQYFAVLNNGDLVNQRKLYSEEGHLGETVLSAAANYDDLLYFGMTIGIQDLDYTIFSNYSETVASGATTDLDSYNLEEYFSVRGTGVNFKAGVIVRPVSFWRIGAAIHTPTFYTLDDEYYADVFSSFITTDENGDTDYAFSSPLSEFEYELHTPWKFIFSTAFLFEDKGAINVDFEMIDYKNAKFKTDFDNDYFYGTIDNPGVNDYVDDQLSNVGNLRIGGEFKPSDEISLRAGYGYYGNPLDDNLSSDLSYSAYSAGLGYKHKNFFMDLSYQFYNLDDNNTFYEGAQDIDFETKKHQAKLTLGWKF